MRPSWSWNSGSGWGYRSGPFGSSKVVVDDEDAEVDGKKNLETNCCCCYEDDEDDDQTKGIEWKIVLW